MFPLQSSIIAIYLDQPHRRGVIGPSSRHSTPSSVVKTMHQPLSPGKQIDTVTTACVITSTLSKPYRLNAALLARLFNHARAILRKRQWSKTDSFLPSSAHSGFVFAQYSITNHIAVIYVQSFKDRQKSRLCQMCRNFAKKIVWGILKLESTIHKRLVEQHYECFPHQRR